jgi:hypothetical protein
VMRMKVGVSRKEATDRDGSVGATCEIEIEIPGNATDEEVRHIRDRWLEMCEDTVDEELDRLRHAASRSGPASPPASATRTTAPPPRPSRPEFGTPPAPTRGRRADDDEGEIEEAAKQVPDAKGLVISFGKKRGYPAKIVDWNDEQVREAYRYARRQQGR